MPAKYRKDRKKKNLKNKTKKKSYLKKYRLSYKSKKIRGGDYSESTTETLEGYPIKDDNIVITIPGLPVMTVNEYNTYMEKLSQDRGNAYLD